MTRIFQVNADNDIFATAGGRLAVAQDLQAVIQQCEHALKAQAGEMVYAVNRGVNALTRVFTGSPNLLSYEASARRQLDRIPDVVAVENFQATLVNNTLDYSVTIRTVFGSGLVEGSAGG